LVEQFCLLAKNEKTLPDAQDVKGLFKVLNSSKKDNMIKRGHFSMFLNALAK